MPSYSYEEFLQNYCQPEDRSGVPGGHMHTLGYGGASTSVEICIFHKVYWSMPDLTNMSFADTAVPTYLAHLAVQERIQCLGSTEAA